MRRLAIALCFFAACDSTRETPPGAGLVTVIDGETIISTRTATAVRTDVFSRAGVRVFTAELVATGAALDYRWATADGAIADTYPLDGDLDDVDLESLNLTAFRQFHLVHRAATGVAGFDNHGCDVFPPRFDCTNFGGCCDVHDACYHDFNCDVGSFLPTSNQGRACRECNREVVRCFVNIVRNGGGSPSSCCVDGEPMTCGQPWCFNTEPVQPCSPFNCCGADGVCTATSTGCAEGTACGSDAYCLSGTCFNKLCEGTPLTVSAGGTFDCAGSGVLVSAQGGTPPYTWSTTAGAISGSGPIVTLVAPPNPGAFLGGTAYSVFDGAPGIYTCSGGHSTCNFGWACIGDGGPIRFFTCSGAFNGGTSCGGAFDCVGFGPACPVDCQAYEDGLGTLAACGTPGVAFDRRSPAQVAGGCNPCALAMAGGATVTVTDAHGQTADVTVGP